MSRITLPIAVSMLFKFFLYFQLMLLASCSQSQTGILTSASEIAENSKIDNPPDSEAPTDLAINPSSKILGTNNAFPFKITGGVKPYIFEITTGQGTVNNLGDYTAPATTTNAILRVTDAKGNFVAASITVIETLTISPTNVTLIEGGTQIFTTMGGISPYTYSVVSGGGSFADSTYTAPTAYSGVVNITVTDMVGNTAAATININAVTVAIVSPTSLDNISSANQTNFPISGTCSEVGQSVLVSASDDNNTPISASTNCATGGAWSTNLDLTSLADTAITITADHSSSTGKAAVTAKVTVYKNGIMPTVSIMSPVDNSYVGNTMTVSGNCFKEGPVTVKVTGNITAVTNCVANTYSATLNIVDLPDGPVAIQVNHRDDKNNEATPVTRSVVKDIISPVIVAFAVINSNPSSTVTFNLSSAATDSSPINNYCILENSTILVNCTWHFGAIPSTFNVSNINNDKILTLWVKDAAGNVSAPVNSNMVHLDTQVSTIWITQPVSPAYIGPDNMASYTVSGTCNKEGASITIKAGSAVVGTINCSSSVWSSSTVNFTGIPSGTFSLTAELNATSVIVSDPVIVTKDITSPEPPTGINDGAWSTSLTTSPPINFTASNDNGGSGILKYQVQVVLGSDSTTVLKNWADFISGSVIADLNLTEGVQYKVNIKAIDKAGNISNLVTTDGWTVDITPPTAPSAVNDGSSASSLTRAPSISWSNSSDTISGIAEYQVAIGTSNGGSEILNWTSVGKFSPASVVDINLTNGSTYYSSLRAVDNAGNISTATLGDGWMVILDALVYMPMNGANNSNNFVNYVNNNITFSTVNTPKMTTDDFVYGNSSANLSSGYLQSPVTATAVIGTSDFTIEFWAKFSSRGAGGTTCLSGTGWYISLGSGSYNHIVTIGMNGEGSHWGGVLNWAIAPVNEWVHYSVTRRGTSIFTHMNGEYKSMLTVDANYNIEAGSATSTITIGNGGNGILIDDLIITKIPMHTYVNFTVGAH